MPASIGLGVPAAALQLAAAPAGAQTLGVGNLDPARQHLLATVALSTAIALSVIAIGLGTLMFFRARRRAAADHRRIRELFGTLARTTAVLDAAPAGSVETTIM